MLCAIQTRPAEREPRARMRSACVAAFRADTGEGRCMQGYMQGTRGAKGARMHAGELAASGADLYGYVGAAAAAPSHRHAILPCRPRSLRSSARRWNTARRRVKQPDYRAN